METIVCHYWVRGKDGSPVLYEAAYQGYWMRPGVLCHFKVPLSDHPCECPDHDACKQHLAAALN